MFSNDLICDILDFIDENMNRKITMDELSNQFYFNKDYIMRLFKKEIHTTISDYINKMRIFQSLPDLQLTTNSILSIGLKHGFTSLEYYSEIFHKIMGVSPISYRKFSTRSIDISEEEINIIKKNLANISGFFENVTRYRHNRKKTLSMNLSIFK